MFFHTTAQVQYTYLLSCHARYKVANRLVIMCAPLVSQTDNALKFAWRPVEETKTNKGVYTQAAQLEYLYVNFTTAVWPTQVGGGVWTSRVHDQPQ